MPERLGQAGLNACTAFALDDDDDDDSRDLQRVTRVWSSGRIFPAIRDTHVSLIHIHSEEMFPLYILPVCCYLKLFDQLTFLAPT